ncbi:MAG: DUF1704 domain-containing protein [Planctomycetes bacterium]|nr:DUF1704 domain-containing protein [Planctomycetota bacterium]
MATDVADFVPAVHPREVMARAADRLDEEFLAGVARNLAADRRVRLELPTWGRLSIERQVPFLGVYRQPPDRWDNGTGRLIMNEVSYLVISGDPRQESANRRLVSVVAEALSRVFGGFLLYEVWAGPDGGFGEVEPGDDEAPAPEFRISTDENPRQLSWTVVSLQSGLERVRVNAAQPVTAVAHHLDPHPPHLPPLVDHAFAVENRVKLVGIGLRPIFREKNDGEKFPRLHRHFRIGFSTAVRRMVFAFSRSYTTHNPPHFHTLGQRAVSDAVWEVDKALSAVDEGFNWLFLLTPSNTGRAWREFRASGCSTEPRFVYRPWREDSFLLKRRLYQAPIEQVEDPALEHLFREKAAEIDRLLTLCRDVDSDAFLAESIQIFGVVSDDEMRIAERLLREVAPAPGQPPSGDLLDAQAVKALAEREYAHYAAAIGREFPEPEISADLPPGCLVNAGKLFIGATTRISPENAAGVIQHEIGTHSLTYFNGREQPLRLLSVGLANYDETQEGLAVLAEHLVGGLDRERLRTLAARVVAVRRVVERRPFAETWRELRDGYRIPGKIAFIIGMRAYRGGGLTKDAIYLRGLAKMLDHLRRGLPLDPFWVGKIHFDHLPIIEELLRREVLRPVLLRPRYLEDSPVRERLARLRAGAQVIDLVPARGSDTA